MGKPCKDNAFYITSRQLAHRDAPPAQISACPRTSVAGRAGLPGGSRKPGSKGRRAASDATAKMVQCHVRQHRMSCATALYAIAVAYNAVAGG